MKLNHGTIATNAICVPIFRQNSWYEVSILSKKLKSTMIPKSVLMWSNMSSRYDWIDPAPLLGIRPKSSRSINGMAHIWNNWRFEVPVDIELNCDGLIGLIIFILLFERTTMLQWLEDSSHKGSNVSCKIGEKMASEVRSTSSVTSNICRLKLCLIRVLNG